MLTVNTKNGTRIRLYDSIKNLDAGRFNDLRKYVVRDAGIGSSMDAINKHHATMDLLLSKNKLPEAIQERQNLHTFYFLAIEKINIQHITFAIFVHSIDDWIVDDHHKDLTESVYMSVCERIYRSKLKQEQVESIFDDLKKKLIPNFELISQMKAKIQGPQITSQTLRKKLYYRLSSLKMGIKRFFLLLKLSIISRST